MIDSVFKSCISSLKNEVDSKIIIEKCYTRRLHDFLKRREFIDLNFNHMLDEIIKCGDIRLITYMIGKLPDDNRCITTFLKLYTNGGF